MASRSSGSGIGAAPYWISRKLPSVGRSGRRPTSSTSAAMIVGAAVKNWIALRSISSTTRSGVERRQHVQCAARQQHCSA